MFQRYALPGALILLVMLFDVVVFSTSTSLQLSLAEGSALFLLPLPLLVLAAYYGYWRTGEAHIAEALALMSMAIWFSQVFALATYVLLDASPHDGEAWLIAADRMLRVDTASIVAWVSAYPLLVFVLRCAYNSLLLQVAVIVAGLALLLRDSRAAWNWLTVCVVGSLVGMLIFWFFPAKGPPAASAHPSADQVKFLLQYDAVRSVAPFSFTLQEATGVITMPSFHAFFALVNVWAVRGHRRLFVAMAVLNALMIASTLTTGWHYVTDVLAAFLMAAVAIGLVKIYENRVGES